MNREVSNTKMANRYVESFIFMETPKEIKNRTTTYDPTIPLLGIYPKEMKSLPCKVICITMFIAALLTIAMVYLSTNETVN